jgi:hypothetical protein
MTPEEKKLIIQKLEKIVGALSGTWEDGTSLSNINISKQFHAPGEDIFSIARNLNAAFLIKLAGEPHRLFKEAAEYLEDFHSHPSWKRVVGFYQEGLDLIFSEITSVCSTDDRFEKDFLGLFSLVSGKPGRKDYAEIINIIYRVFFPEGVLPATRRGRDDRINQQREKRKIRISRLNRSPVTDPAGEILFTSNILITVPPPVKHIDGLPVSQNIKKMLHRIIQEDQMFWYDHPIPVGINPEHNEILHGLEGLDQAVEFEKAKGNIKRGARLNCALSVSVTHEGLQGIAKEYLENEFRKEKNIRHLDVYIFTEADTIRIIKEILIPAAENYLGIKDHSPLFEVMGVDGEYGRHYSFLKAIAAFWQVFIDRGIKGTFKIDLDQVFPQRELVAQSGLSAFEHLGTSLWGAEGIDSAGQGVDLGMIAGSLVNAKDISHSLYRPDVKFPVRKIKADEVIFFSTLPQALSTEAEMMTRYTDEGIDGKKTCIQRIHVTGGTNGILIKALRKYRPFTPTFIGRAEDQAFILSVLFKNKDKNLRYVHKDGLIMRHDKESFAAEAIKAAATGKLIGDYIRILIFSYYVRALPWPFEDIKDIIDPFTGCFVSRIPLTVVYLRFALKAASFFDKNTKESDQQGFEFLQAGTRRLRETIQKLNQQPNPLIDEFERENMGWGIYYDVLDRVEENLKKEDSFPLELKKRAEAIIAGCKINFK